MKALVVVENTARWPLDVPGASVVAASDYVEDPAYAELRGVAVYNLCRHYTYQRLGYYVSLLGAARGHRPLPSVETLQAVRTAAVVRLVGDELGEAIERALAPLRSPRFVLSIYFGRNPTRRYDRLSRALFNAFPAPFLRAVFERSEDGEWALSTLRPISTADIPDAHREFVVERAAEFFAAPTRTRRRSQLRYSMAILWRPGLADAPSDDRAIRKFIRAARSLDIDASMVTPDDYGRIAEYDALFIRETTYVTDHTYRFAARAEAEGMVVIDDPRSIIRATNKVFQAEVFERRGIPCPPTLVVGKGTPPGRVRALGFPLVLKRPDSSFSAGVVRVEDAASLDQTLATFFESSDLVIAQAFTPTEFDWRIGVLDGAPLYAARYHMVKGHWQIIRHGQRSPRYGRVETVAVKDAPNRAVKVALLAAAEFGDGLYGVDVKPVGKRFLVVEVNDNPSIEAGYEDQMLGDELYLAVMRVFRRRLDARGDAGR